MVPKNPNLKNFLKRPCRRLFAAEIQRSREDKQGETLLHAERFVGKIHRAFSLAQDVDETQAQAKYNDGVLELRLPKKAAVSALKLSIQ